MQNNFCKIYKGRASNVFHKEIMKSKHGILISNGRIENILHKFRTYGELTNNNNKQFGLRDYTMEAFSENP